MRKLLGSALALAVLFSSSQVSAAELFKNVTATGQIDLQMTSARNTLDFVTRGDNSTTNNDRISNAQTRLMASIGMDLLDDVHAMVTVRKNDRTYGTNGGVSNPTTGNSQNLVGTAGGNDVLGNIFVDQAYFKVDKIGGSVDATFGRQFYGNSGDMIIYFGPSDKALYGLPVTALDAARFDWANDKVGVTGVFGKVTGADINVSGATELDLRGVIASCKGEGNVHGSVYLWNVLTHASGALGSDAGKNDNLYVLGAKAKAQMGNAWIKGEIAKNFGDNRPGGANPSASYTGWMASVNGGVKAEIGGVGAVTPWGEATYGTGDKEAADNVNQGFQAINADYRPGLIYGRFSSNTGLSGHNLGGAIGSGGGVTGSNSANNRVIIAVGAKVTPESLNKLTVGAQLTSFHTQTNFSPTQPGQPESLGGNKNIGNEYGVEATWAHSENVSMTATAAQFAPGGLIRAARNATNDHRNNPAQMLAFDVRVKFGGAGH